MEGPERRYPKDVEAEFPSCIVFSLPKHYNGRPRSRGVFAASENKSTLLQEVEKRHEQGVYITKKRCAELDGAARLRLNFCDYPFSSGQTCLSPDGKTVLRQSRCRKTAIESGLTVPNIAK